MSQYIPMTDTDREEMLKSLGLKDIEGLFAGIPSDVRLKRELDLPEALSEYELKTNAKKLASRNVNSEESVCFLGAGVYDHYIPSVVKHIISREEFYTAYTPYQPEISQGMLQAIFEYQTMICELTGMYVSNASHYDGATAAAEAASMAANSTGRNEILVSAGLNPEYRKVIDTYARFNGLGVAEIGLKDGRTDLDELRERLSQNTAAFMVQSPNFFGIIEEMQKVPELAHSKGALAIAVVDPISLGILKSPGECGFDIAAGEGQPLGNPMSFGGPYLGFLASTKELMRKIPGRIVGQTVDKEGRRGFVLTLQAREQHIRREKAVSNICSNEALNALAAVVYLTVVGKQGLKEIGELCVKKSHYAYDRLLQTGKFEKVSNAPFFKEFTLRSKAPVEGLNSRLLKEGITGGLDLTGRCAGMDNCWLLAVTEKRTKQDIDRLAEIAARE